MPKLVDLTDSVLFGDVWERPELSKRERGLITVAALVALNRLDQLRFHLGKAVENGVGKSRNSSKPLFMVQL
ncbi:MAG: carboxymuconolactone decarboxylase family protein [Candidatus Acidiferrales bacterium]